jgi:lysophospholipase L1-like esterase
MIYKSFYLRMLAWLFGLIVSFGFGTSVLAGPCPDGIIAIWSLEESGFPYQDWPDSNNDAICDGACPSRINENDAVVGAANRFNNGGLRVPDGTAFNWTGTDSFSIELWVRNSGAVTTDQALIGRTDGNFSWNVSLLGNGTVGFNLNDSNNPIALTSSKVLSTPQSSLGARWHHVAAVRNGDDGMTQLFVDGQLADSVTQTFTGGFSSDSASLAIGWSGDNSTPQRFSGDLDEVAIYQSPLTQAEIRSHYYLARHYCELYRDQVHIMPLGNSITFDDSIGDIRPDGDRGGYRYPLWQSLSQEHYLFDFVGNREAGFNLDPDFDPNNAGFPGITTAGLLNLLRTSYNDAGDRYEGNVSSDTPYLPRYPSDVILLHIGTNGLNNPGGIPGFVDDVANILNEIDGYSPNITVVVARIIHNVESDFDASGTELPNNVTHQYNDALEQMVHQRITAGDKLLMVDMEDGAGIDYMTEMRDHLHPNPAGYVKIAAQWYSSLQGFLPQLELPQITSEPVKEAAAGQEYQYQVTASGSPPPQFSLATAPDGMTIDPDSGLITWTAPNTIGASVYVSVEAQNIDPADADWARVATQNFSISIVKEVTGNGNGNSGGSGSNSSSGGCFIQSMSYDHNAGPVWGWVFCILMLGGIVGNIYRIKK